MNHSGTGVTLSSNMYIKASTGTLNLTAGKIITGSYEVNVANTATSSVTSGSTTSFVQGNLRRYILSTGAYDFPVGHAIKGYQLANINFTSATSIANLSARFDSWTISPVIQGGSECGTTYNMAAEDNGWWTITANANASTGIYNTKLYPLNSTNVASAQGWTVMKSATAEAGPWALVGNCNISSTASLVERDSMSGFSLFGVAQSVSPLPIELITFKGTNEVNRNFIEWTTASETNNDYFTVEHSVDASNFLFCGKVQGAGNSTHTNNYNVYDNSPFSNITYYRLKQTDFNGSYKYSDVISVESQNNKNSFEIVKAGFTSSESYLEILINCSFNCELNFEIYDMNGQLIHQSKQNSLGVNTKIEIPALKFNKGILLLKVFNGEKIVTKKLIK